MSELANIAQQFSGLPMESLIGGPLVAAAEANSRMAQAQVDFMLSTCFNTQNVTRQIMKDGIVLTEKIKVR